MSDESNDKKNILKSKFFLKLFGIPCGVWLILSLIAMTDKTDPELLTLEDFFIGNIIIFIIWFIISFFIAFFHAKKETKDIKVERILEKKCEETSTFSKIIFPLIMSIITFVIGIFLSYDSIGFPLKAQLIIFLVAFAPFIIFIIFVFMIYKYNKKKKVVYALKTISIVITCLLLFYYFIALFFVVLIEATNPMTNPKYYSYHISVTPVLKKAFPSKIPKNVDNVKFFYVPGILQGGTRYTLYYIDKNMTCDKFDKKYKKQAEWVGHKDGYTEKRGLLSGAFYSTPSEYKNENDYIIYLIDGNCDNSGYCNHGSFLIAAFNEKTHEIVFSAEDW